MYFGPIPTAEAAGAILAHSLKAAGRTLKKGRVLNATDLEVLAAAGHGTVVGARLEPGDLHEDEAAGRLAGALAGPGLAATKAFTGRSNLKAEGRGLLVIDRARLEAINRVDEGITVASLGPLARVEPGQMAATIKIIPFAVDGKRLERCLEIASGSPVLALGPFRPRAAGLIQTRLPGTRDSVLDKTRAAVDGRLAALGCPPAAERRIAHEEAAVARAIEDLLEQGCALVLLSGASAIVDRRDVLPAGMARAGASIDHFGMPVDPGNLILLGHLESTPLIGLPGCARSPKLNGFDWVLERVIADLPVGGAEVMAMGAGGLLKEIPERPLPRSGPESKGRGGAPKIAGLLLAAGRSRRLGAGNKLLERVDGTPLVARTARNLKASRASPLLAVTGHDYERVERVLEGEGLRFVHNPAFARGMASTLKRGIAALPEDVDGAVVCLGDMPLVGPAVIDALIAAFDPLEGRAICIPTWNGKRGNPVLLARGLFPEVEALAGDVGARALIARHADEVCEVPVEDQGILVDVDTAEALESLRKPRS